MNRQQAVSKILWNTIGNIFYLGSQWLLSVIVVRISHGYTDAGILSLSISLTNIFAILALFSVRNYQVSDLECRYNDADYIFHRIITCTLALILCTVFTVFSGYKRTVALSIIGYMLLKIVEALSDVFHGILQKQWRFDIIGRSYLYRGIVLLFVFSAVYKLSGQLWVSLFSIGLSTFVLFVLYDLRFLHKTVKISWSLQRAKLVRLTKECFPLLIYVFIFNLIVPITRFLIERCHGEEVLGYYSSVAVISVIIQAAVVFLFAPFNSIISNYYIEENYKAILHLSYKITLFVIGITCAVLLGVWVFGKQALVLIFGNSIAPYTELLYPTIISSMLNALGWFLGMLLTIMRSMKSLLVGSAAGLLMCIVLSVAMIPQDAYGGANAAAIAGFAVTVMAYTAAVIRRLSAHK